MNLPSEFNLTGSVKIVFRLGWSL